MDNNTASAVQWRGCGERIADHHLGQNHPAT